MNVTDVTPKTAVNPRKMDRYSWVVLSLDTSDGDAATDVFESHSAAQVFWDEYDSSDTCYRPIRIFKITYKENE